MSWQVYYKNRKVLRQAQCLPVAVQKSLDALIADIEKNGPVRGDWPNYSKLSKGLHHCHIKKGKPTYVVVWRELENNVCVVEVTYVGTHENAPY